MGAVRDKSKFSEIKITGIHLIGIYLIGVHSSSKQLASIVYSLHIWWRLLQFLELGHRNLVAEMPFE